MKKVFMGLVVMVAILIGGAGVSAQRQPGFKVTQQAGTVTVTNTDRETHQYNVKASFNNKKTAFNFELKPGKKIVLVGGADAVLVGKEFKNVKLTVMEFTKKQERYYSRTARVCSDKQATTKTLNRIQKDFTLKTDKRNNMAVLTNNANKTRKFHVLILARNKRTQLDLKVKPGEKTTFIGGLNWSRVYVNNGKHYQKIEPVKFNDRIKKYYEKQGWDFSQKDINQIKNFEATNWTQWE